MDGEIEGRIYGGIEIRIERIKSGATVPEKKKKIGNLYMYLH
jgi:hypothetical protein